MLVLSRKLNEIIDIGPDISIEVVDIRDDKVRIGIQAPQHVVINRREITNRMAREAEDRADQVTDQNTDGK